MNQSISHCIAYKQYNNTTAKIYNQMGKCVISAITKKYAQFG